MQAHYTAKVQHWYWLHSDIGTSHGLLLHQKPYQLTNYGLQEDAKPEYQTTPWSWFANHNFLLMVTCKFTAHWQITVIDQCSKSHHVLDRRVNLRSWGLNRRWAGQDAVLLWRSELPPQAQWDTFLGSWEQGRNCSSGHEGRAIVPWSLPCPSQTCPALSILIYQIIPLCLIPADCWQIIQHVWFLNVYDSHPILLNSSATGTKKPKTALQQCKQLVCRWEGSSLPVPKIWGACPAGEGTGQREGRTGNPTQQRDGTGMESCLFISFPSLQKNWERNGGTHTRAETCYFPPIFSCSPPSGFQSCTWKAEFGLLV